MVSTMDKRKNGRKPIIYNKYGNKPDDPLVVMEDMFEYMASCPLCERRVFDVSDIPGVPVHVRLKCPHCKNFVEVPICKTP